MFSMACNTINESYTDGYNTDPNNPTDANAEKVFIGGESALIEYMESEPAWFASMWTRQATGSDRQFNRIHQYGVNNEDFSSMWFLAYTRALTNLKIAEEKASETGKNNLVAVAKINEAMVMGTTAALWGNVPYPDSPHPDGNYVYEYLPQADVYDMVQTKLDEAIQALGTDLPSGVDAFSYAGNADLWVKAAYTLKARFYMHTGNYGDALTAAQNGVLATDGSEDLMIPHGSTYQGDMNLWYSFMVYDRSGYLTAEDNLAYGMMQDNSDNHAKTDESGRMAYFYNADGTDLNTSDGAFAIDASYPLIRASETHLIMAEAELKENNDDAAALTHLNAARQYAENMYGGTYDDLTLLDFQVGGDYENTTLQQEIYDETYLALMFQVEAFDFTRRIDWQVTGLTPVSGNSQFPERFLYSQDEINSNPNTPEQSAADLYKPTPANQ